MIFRFTRYCFVAALLWVPTTVVAQFGVAGGRRKQGSNFENLQEMAKKQQEQAAGGGAPDLNELMNSMMGGAGGAGMEDLQKRIQEAMADPETQKYLEQMGGQFAKAMEEMAKLTPEEIQAQMSQAFEVMQSGEMLTGLVEQREQIIAQLEAMGAIPADEIARMKTDPDFFELKMRESFDQMKDAFQNPDVLNALSGLKEMMDSGDEILDEMTKMLTSGEFQDDEKIEEARLQILRGDFNTNPLMKEMFESEEMQELLKDPIKWRESVKEGQENINSAMGGKDEL
mmetsp:Transcript_15008/g.28440  ORF Transcript_15008/g.28440 Transcript_15008/m.28440 type:complete len:285 (+) Transcript_15008:131-985(+)